jgi:gamma-glutamyltranspeptidase
MDDIFVPGSVKTMYSQRLRYGDVDWPTATQAAAKVMPSGGKVSMNVWTQNPQEVAALKTAFERAGFKDIRIWGSAPGPGTMLDAVR